MPSSARDKAEIKLLELQECEDPVALFENWFDSACQQEVSDPTAMALATVDADGAPNVRMVLFKHMGDDGFVFYTNTLSSKGEELKNNGRVALCMHWKSLRRQVRVQGVTQPVSEDEADAYFRTRPRDSQIGAWASQQSQAVSGRDELERAVEEISARYENKEIDRPPHWSGYRVRVLKMEFWRERPFRLHDRKVFERSDPDSSQWRSCYLYP